MEAKKLQSMVKQSEMTEDTEFYRKTNQIRTKLLVAEVRKSLAITSQIQVLVFHKDNADIDENFGHFE
jgi:hypothetical protein